MLPTRDLQNSRRHTPHALPLPEFRQSGLTEHLGQLVQRVFNSQGTFSEKVRTLTGQLTSTIDNLDHSLLKAILVSEVVGGLAQLHRSRDAQPAPPLRQWLENLLPTVRDLAPLFSASQVSRIAPALVQLEIIDTEVFKALAACATERAPDLRPRQLSDTAWAFGQRTKANKPLFEALSACAKTLVGTLEARHITDLAVAFARAKYRDQALFDALCLQGTKTLATFREATDILETARALPMLAAKRFAGLELNTPAQVFFTGLASRVQEQITSFRAPHVAAAHDAFVKLLPPDAPLLQVVREHSLTLIKQSTRRELVLLARTFSPHSERNAEVLKAIRTRAEAHLTCQSNTLIETVDCFSGLQQTPRPLADALHHHLPTRTLTELQELTRFLDRKLKKDPPLAKAIRKSVARRLAGLDLTPREFAPAAIFLIDEEAKGTHAKAALRSLALRELPNCSARELADLAKPFARLYRGDDLLFDAIGDAARKKIDAFSARDIAYLCKGFQIARHRNEGLFQRIADEVNKRISSFNPKDIAQIAYSFAFLNVKHGPMIQALASRLFQQGGSRNGIWNRERECVALFAWSAAVLEPRIVRQHYKPEDLDRDGLDDSSWLQLFQALHASGTVDANFSHPRYHTVVTTNSEVSAGRADRFTLRFKTVLGELLDRKLPKTHNGTPYEIKLHTVIAGAAVDLELRIGRRKIIFECDGVQYHRSTGPQRRALGKDIIQERSAHRLNYEVIHICSERWGNPDSRQVLIKEIESRIGTGPS
jgi:hypothetical protein